MRRKFKYFGVLPFLLTTFLATTMIVSCSDEQEGVLSSIEVTSLPTTLEYAVNSSFRRAGLEVTAYYYGGTSKPITYGEYTLSSPDMSTAGEKEVIVSYTEDEVTVTTSFNITVYDNPIVDLSISDEFTVSVGDNIDDLYVPVYAVYENGNTSLLSSSEYSIYSNMSGVMSEPTVGYIVAEYNENAAIYDEVRTLKFEAEDASKTGDIKLGTNYNVECAYSTTGGDIMLGSLIFNFTVTEAGTYDISLSATNSYVYNTAAETSEHYLEDGTGHYYDQNDLALNTVTELNVNGTDYEIDDTAVHNLGLRVDGLTYYLGTDGFQLIRLANVPLNIGSNTVTITLIESTIGQTNRWGNSPSINVDYLRIDGADPKSIVGIEVASLPDITSYLVDSEFDSTGLEINAVYDDGSTGLILDHTYSISSVDTSTAGTKTVTVTYDDYGYTTTFDITVVTAPDSIRIDDSYELNFYDDLSNLSVPVIASLSTGVESTLAESRYTVVAKQNGQVVTGNAGFDTYTIEITYNEDTSITYSQNYTVTRYTYDVKDFTGTNLPSVTTNYGHTYMEINMTNDGTATITFPVIVLPSNSYVISMDMINLYVYGSYTTYPELKLNGLISISLGGTDVAISDDVIVEGGDTYSSMQEWLGPDSVVNVDLAQFSLTEETTLDLSITFTADETQLNRWNESSIVVLGFYIIPVS